MRCLAVTSLPQIAVISGLPVDRLEPMGDPARRQPQPPLPPDAKVMAAVLAGLPASHALHHGVTMLPMVDQSQDHPHAAQTLSLRTALVRMASPDAPSPDLVRVQGVRKACERAAGYVLPRYHWCSETTLTTIRVGSWKADEEGEIAPHPARVG